MGYALIVNGQKNLRKADKFTHAFQKHQRTMIGQEQTELAVNFSNQWKRVSKTYHAFKKHLNRKGLNYNGQLYRDLAEGLVNGKMQLPYTQVIFAGFNALSISEERIFDHLENSGVGSMYWDADRWYLEQGGDSAF